jgi:hypothetical protein
MAPGETRDSFEALIALGAMAWNLSLLPGEERAEGVRLAVKEGNAIGLPLTSAWMNDLIDRKSALFPLDDRFIEGWEVRAEPDGRFTVLVASSL